MRRFLAQKRQKIEERKIALDRPAPGLALHEAGTIPPPVLLGWVHTVSENSLASAESWVMKTSALEGSWGAWGWRRLRPWILFL